ncbi:MAG: hypothetical protein ACLP1X_10910 [Polyangiaceae bacterium]
MRVAEAVVRWYLALYHRTPDDPGVARTFRDPAKVGAFAVTVAGLRRQDSDELFRLLVATSMFQRRQDLQILRVLRGMSTAQVDDLTRPRRLLALVDEGACAHMRSAADLQEKCDLSKDPISKTGVCSANPRVPCHMKVHTVLMRRYGHFGKVPTSAALMIREAGADGLRELREKVLRTWPEPEARARALESELSKAWRVSNKIACMFLSSLATPDLAAGPTPWTQGIDWTHFVVIDSNVDLFLASIGYAGTGTYEARREFIRDLARRIDLRRLGARLHAFNPRLVQQAMYLFMSATNRKAAARDPEMYNHWVEMEHEAQELSRAADAARRGYQRTKLSRFAFLAGRANNMLARELQQSLNPDKAKKLFETAQTQFEAAVAATSPKEVSPKLLRALVLNSDALGLVDRVFRYFDIWREVAPGDPLLSTERARLSRKYGRE